MTASQRVVRRLREEHGLANLIPEGSTIQRTYAGWAMKANGAWTWFLVGPDGRPLPFGSQYPATVLLRFPEWAIDPISSRSPDRSIWPVDAGSPREATKAAR